MGFNQTQTAKFVGFHKLIISRELKRNDEKEFAAHEEISQALEADTYFAHFYASWERGTNENTNGLIRQYIPKDADFKTLTAFDISFVEYRLNTRPRKCLSFSPPIVFLKNHCCT
jgi:transposase, IS30 family